jgi:hypothetical protein
MGVEPSTHHDTRLARAAALTTREARDLPKNVQLERENFFVAVTTFTNKTVRILALGITEEGAAIHGEQQGK